MNEKSGVLHVQWQIQDFPGGANPRWGSITPHNFCQKLYENEKNWTEMEGTRDACPLDPLLISLHTYSMYIGAEILYGNICTLQYHYLKS